MLWFVLNENQLIVGWYLTQSEAERAARHVGGVCVYEADLTRAQRQQWSEMCSRAKKARDARHSYDLCRPDWIRPSPGR